MESLEDIKFLVPIENIEIASDVKEIKEKLLQGCILIQKKGIDLYALIPAKKIESREVAMPETEFSVLGPKEAFVESLDKNLNLIRKRLPIPELRVKELAVGKFTKTRVAVVYIEGIANPKNVRTVIERIEKIDYDHIIDSSYIRQFIADNPNTPFAQMVDSERSDRVVAVLSEGKIAIIVDGTPQVLTLPTSFFEFFSSFEDYFLGWQLATAFRIIRFFGILFSIFATPMYVAIITYHYQMVPIDLLGTLISSRSDIPFSPIFEALILEIAIELLREAGARLPTKVGQTLGIVGGIVIGTASVEAGLTSNVLLIIVAVGALATFTTPVYRMSNAIRLIRFPFIIMAQMFGLVGIAISASFTLAHLLRLESVGNPYLAPLYPLRIRDFKDSLIRLPFQISYKRPNATLSPQPYRREPDQKGGKGDEFDTAEGK